MDKELMHNPSTADVDHTEIEIQKPPKRMKKKLYIIGVITVLVLIPAIIIAILLATGVIDTSGASGNTPTNTTRNGVPDELWNYVTVRPGAHMFYWFYGSNTSTPRDEAPMILWLQGGPGGSSTGYGNFAEIGPINIKLLPRNSTWLTRANLLFIDNPVGAGWSYVDNASLYTTNVDEIATDLLAAIKEIFNKLPKMKKVPFYIFSESYGGKMAAVFGVKLKTAIISGNVQCDFRGVALGDPWMSPYDSVNSWGPYLHAFSLMDKKELSHLGGMAATIKDLIAQKQYANATQLWLKAEHYISSVTANVNFYNVLYHDSNIYHHNKRQHFVNAIDMYNPGHFVTRRDGISLSQVMNGPIRKKLGKVIPSKVSWGKNIYTVFFRQENDFMRPAIDMVDKLLNMNVIVAVYNGQFDLICDVLGTQAWIDQLQWTYLPEFRNTKKLQLKAPGARTPTGFYKRYRNFSFFWLLGCGHMVPVDIPKGALHLLDTILSF